VEEEIYRNFCYNIISMKGIGIKFIFVLILVFLGGQTSAMNSDNYQINWDSLNSGGEDTSSSTNYSIQDTLGGLATGKSSSDNYIMQSGYRLPEGEESYILFDVDAQLNSSQIAYTIFDNGGTKVTVDNSAGYSIDDYIVVVENIGAEQKIAIGKISSIDSKDIFVDAWEGDNSEMSASSGGDDDYVYKLNGSALELGSLSYNTVETAVSFVNVSTSASNGYVVQYRENYNLRASPSIEIADVSDSAVSAGNEEYGIETVGQDAQGTGDQAITDSLQNLANDAGAVVDRRTGVIYKTSITAGTTAGSYSHTVSYYCTVNY
jgi:hypothetical protein